MDRAYRSRNRQFSPQFPPLPAGNRGAPDLLYYAQTGKPGIMNYQSFIGLRTEEQAYHTFTFGTYRGTNREGDDVYELYDFWITVQENTKGFCFTARTAKPEGFIASEVLNSQEL